MMRRARYATRPRRETRKTSRQLGCCPEYEVRCQRQAINSDGDDAAPVRDFFIANSGYWIDEFHFDGPRLDATQPIFDTHGEPQEFVSAAKYGYLLQGQYYEWQDQGRGTPTLNTDPARFVVYLQNHDQIANSAAGRRGHTLTSPGRWRAMTTACRRQPLASNPPKRRTA